MERKIKKREKRIRESMSIRHEEKMLWLCLKATQILGRIDCVDSQCANLISYLTEIRLLAAKQYQIAAERANPVAFIHSRSDCNCTRQFT